MSFIAGLLEDRRLDFRVANMPHADKFQLHIYAALAEQEREFISIRTKAGLAAAKARGVKLGGPCAGTRRENAAAKAAATARSETLRPLLEALQSQGASLRVIGKALHRAGIATANGEPLSPTQVKRHLQRLGITAGAPTDQLLRTAGTLRGPMKNPHGCSAVFDSRPA